MLYNQLGKSSLHVSEIALGCMSLPLGDIAACSAIVDRAIALNINFFDTADLYNQGENEAMLGRLLRSKRKQLVIATKVGNQWRPGGSGWDWNPTKKYILGAVEESLRRLQTDYIDLYQLHGGTIGDPIEETIEAFETLQQQGKIRYYGISSIRPNVIRAYVSQSAIVSVMMQYSLADRRPEETILPLLVEKNIGVLARGSLAQGLLVGKPTKEYLGHSADALKKAAGIIQQLSTDGRSPALVAAKYVLQQVGITSAIIGCSKPVQLEEIAGQSKGFHLQSKELEWLSSILPARKYELHR